MDTMIELEVSDGDLSLGNACYMLRVYKYEMQLSPSGIQVWV